MNRKVLNYGVTYKINTENGTEDKDEVFYTKKDMLKRYLNILDGDNKLFPICGVGSVSELKIYVRCTNCQILDITGKVNKFIA